jgi:hypothetical protein
LSHRIVLISSFAFLLTNWPSIGMCQCLYVRVQLKIMSNKWSFLWEEEKKRKTAKERRKGAEMMLLIFAHTIYMRSHLLIHLCTRFVFVLLHRHFQINDMRWNTEEKETEREREKTTNPFRRDQLHRWQNNDDKPLIVIVYY